MTTNDTRRDVATATTRQLIEEAMYSGMDADEPMRHTLDRIEAVIRQQILSDEAIGAAIEAMQNTGVLYLAIHGADIHVSMRDGLRSALTSIGITEGGDND